MQQHKIVVIVLIVILSLSTVLGVVGADEGIPQWNLIGVNTPGCNGEMLLDYSWASLPGLPLWEMTVVVDELIYTDLYRSLNLPGPNGTGVWAVRDANDRGLQTGTWPMPSGQEVDITIKIRRPDTEAVVWITEIVLDDCEIANVILADGYPVDNTGIAVPNRGLIQINADQPIVPYMRPDMGPIPGLILPQDADGNGSDTYVVTGWRRYQGGLWLGIFLGSEDWGWVPAKQVQILQRGSIDFTE